MPQAGMESNPGMCPYWELDQWLLLCETMPSHLSHASQGRILNFLMMGPSMCLLSIAMFALWVFKFGNAYSLILNIFFNYFIYSFCLSTCSFLFLEHLLFGLWTCWTGPLIPLLFYFSIFLFLNLLSEKFLKYISQPNRWGFHLCYLFFKVEDT